MTIEYKDSKRIVALSSDVADTITFEDDTFSSGWTSTGSDVVTGTNVIDFDFSNSNATNTISYDLGSTMSDTNWVLRFKLIMDNYNVGSSGNSAGGFFGLFSADHATNDNATQDSIMMNIRATSAGSSYHKYYYADCDGETPRNKLGGDGSFTHTPTEETLYVEIKRTSSTAYTINLYSDSSYSTLVESKTGACASTVTGLRYIKFMNLNSASVSDHDIDGTIDDIEFYNGVSSLTNKPTNVQDNSLLVEKDTARRYWFSEALAPTFEDDFTSDNSVDQDASKISVNTAQERWDFNIVNDQTNDSSSIDIGSALSDSKWVMDFDYTWTNLSGTTNVNTSFFGISNSNGTVPSQTAQDHIGVRFQTGAGFSLYGCHSNNGTMQSGLSSAFTTVPSVTTLYFRIIRTSTTSMTVKIYTTSARTTISEEKTVAVSASTTGLRYVKISPYEGTNGGSNTEVGYVKNLKIYNAVSTPTPATWTRKLPVTSGLKLHLDASESSTITKDSSNLVSQWNDFSSQGNNISQATSSKQPLFVENVQNGRPVIRFDGSNDMLQRTTYVNGALTQPNTVFYVGKIGGNEDFTFASGTLGSENSVLTTGSNLTMYAGTIYGADNAVTTLQQYTFLYNTTSSTMRVNGTQTDTGSVGTHTMQGFTVGANYTDAQWSAIDVCEILVYNGTLSDTNRDEIESYLMEKWGLS